MVITLDQILFSKSVKSLQIVKNLQLGDLFGFLTEYHGVCASLAIKFCPDDPSLLHPVNAATYSLQWDCVLVGITRSAIRPHQGVAFALHCHAYRPILGGVIPSSFGLAMVAA